MNIKIRHAKPSDYFDIYKIYCDPAVVAGTLQLPHPSEELWRQRLAQPPPNLYNLVAVVDDHVVGQLSLMTAPNRPRRHHAATISMAVHSDYHGRGIGSLLMIQTIDLAENWLNINRLELQLFTDNLPAIHLYKKFRFTIEGTLINYAFRNGSYADIYTMARLREIAKSE